jgi:hypothetical protein
MYTRYLVFDAHGQHAFYLVVRKQECAADLLVLELLLGCFLAALNGITEKLDGFGKNMTVALSVIKDEKAKVVWQKLNVPVCAAVSRQRRDRPHGAPDLARCGQFERC